MKAQALILIAALAVSPAGLTQGPPTALCTDGDKECAARALRNHPVGRLETWRAAFSLPPGDRIGPASPQLVDYIRLDNVLNGIADRPHTAEVSAGLISDAKAAMAELPAEIWKLFGERLAGIYFVQGLGGTGYADYVRDSSSRHVAAFVVLNANVLERQRANAWASWKENTPFLPSADYRLEARIETDAGNNRKNAIQYILLHELGHVLSVDTGVHPPWNLRPKDVAVGAKYAFFDLSWTVNRVGDVYQSRFDATFPQRRNAIYYFGAKLAATDMAPTYENLKKTNFPSLYAATHPGDDFAESFASYVHVVLMRRPWQITIMRNDKVIAVFPACWNEPRCAEKRAILEALLKRDR